MTPDGQTHPTSAGRETTATVPVRIVPPPGPLGPLASYRVARRNILGLVPEPAYHRPVLSGGPGPGWHMVMDPVLLEQILKTREANYPKSDVTLRMLRPTEGGNLFVATGADWRWQHRAMAPVFQHRQITGIAPVMMRAAETTCERLTDNLPRAGGIVDVYPQMVGATCDVICDTALSGRETLDRSALTGAITRYIETVARLSILDVFAVPMWVPRPARLLDRAGPAMDRMMDAIIAARLARGPGTPPDLLDLLIAAEDPKSGRRMDRIALRNNLLIFIVAGHETTALALTWALYLLSLHPEVQVQARAEAQAVLGDRAAGAADVPHLGAVRRILDEAMRLYPPAGFLTRQAREADDLDGLPVRKGQTLILPIYTLHRHRLLWAEPDRFDPDRFLPEAVRARHRYAYLPFGAGPRICIGMGFATMEAVIILATLLARFNFAPRAPGAVAPQPEMVLTLRPTGGMPLRVTRV